MFSPVVVSLFATLAAAAPTALTHRGVGTTFNLLFAASGQMIPDSVAALKTGIWAVASHNNHAVLLPREDASLFYEYGSSRSVGTASTGTVITPGGTSTVPSGAPIELINNNATAGVAVYNNDEGVPILHYDGGRFQACAGEDEIFLSFIAAGQRQLADCAVVELIAACSGAGQGSEMVGQLGQPIEVSCNPN